MMRSTYNDNNNNNANSDEDDFAPNPFRSGSSITTTSNINNNNNNSMDFFETPIPQLQSQQQQVSYTQQQQQQRPDPNTGMVGTVQQLPAYDHNNNNNNYVTQQQQQQQQYLTGTMDNNNNQNSRNGATPPAAAPPSGMVGVVYSLFHSCIQYDTVQALFDIDTIDIYIRIKASITKFHHPDYFRLQVLGAKPSPQQQQQQTDDDTDLTTTTTTSPGKGPDLYGPIWISMTCMFILGITANINDYYRHVRNNNKTANKDGETIDEEFEYDLTHLLNAMYVCFTYTFGISTFFWLVCICIGLNSGHNRYLSWTYWVCHYGYSLIPILFGTCLAWILPYTLYHWIVLGAATAMSALFIVRNLATPLLEQDTATTNNNDTAIGIINNSTGTPGTSAHAKAAPILLSILGVHFTFLLVLKLTFYP